MNKLKNMKLFLYIFTFEEEDSKDLKIKKLYLSPVFGSRENFEFKRELPTVPFLFIPYR